MKTRQGYCSIQIRSTQFLKSKPIADWSVENIIPDITSKTGMIFSVIQLISAIFL
jgi:hypothetical protein